MPDRVPPSGFVSAPPPGLQNGFANMAGVIAPVVTGWIVQSTGRFHAAFVFAEVIALAGAAFLTAGVGKIEPVQFRKRA